MTWYAETADLRRRQIATDALVALWILLWLRIGRAVHDGVQRLAAPGVELEQAGRKLEALEAYKAALLEDPRMADCCYNLALLCEELKKPREAIRYMAQYRRLLGGKSK